MKKMSEIDRMRKYYSVKCNCGHRIFFTRRKVKYIVCRYCGTKHLSPREVFKARLRIYLEMVNEG